jgi:hypothetical protein
MCNPPLLLLGELLSVAIPASSDHRYGGVRSLAAQKRNSLVKMTALGKRENLG